jgi:hypothetical protein
MQKVSDKTLVKNNIFGGRNRLKYSSITDLSESKVLINSLRKIILQLSRKIFVQIHVMIKKMFLF